MLYALTVTPTGGPGCVNSRRDYSVMMPTPLLYDSNRGHDVQRARFETVSYNGRRNYEHLLRIHKAMNCGSMTSLIKPDSVTGVLTRNIHHHAKR